MDFVSIHPPLPASFGSLDSKGSDAKDSGAGLDMQIVGISPDGLQILSKFQVPQGSSGCVTLLATSTEAASGVVFKITVESVKQDTPEPEPQWTITCGMLDSADRAGAEKLLTSLRKGQHIEICAQQNVEAVRTSTAFDEVHLLPCTLPELNWENIDPSVNFLGRTFSSPMMITGMTGGLSRGAEINHRLARAAAAHNIPMGVGSQRIALEHQEYSEIFAVKREVPDVFLIANLGVAQLKKLGRGGCLRAVEMIEADALAIHVNILQEVVQVEGDRNFADFLNQIEEVVRDFPVPVILKEVGAGVDPITALRLANIGITCIDVGGVGGTSWSRIEGLRAGAAPTQRLGEVFRDWGIPTAHCIKLIQRVAPNINVTATGGIRDGLMVAKAVALGATMAGIGLPLFRAALADENGPANLLDQYLRELKTAMLCSGARGISDLRQRVMTSESFDKTNAAYVRGYSQAQGQGLVVTAKDNFFGAM